MGNDDEPMTDQRPAVDDKPHAPASDRPPRVLRPASAAFDDGEDVPKRPPRVLRPAAEVESEEDDEPYALSENKPPERDVKDFAPQPAFRPSDPDGAEPPHASRGYLIWSILNLLCCANPLGIVCSIIAIILYCKANLHFQQGNIASGMRLNDQTMMANIIATLLNILLIIYAIAKDYIYVTP